MSVKIDYKATARAARIREAQGGRYGGLPPLVSTTPQRFESGAAATHGDDETKQVTASAALLLAALVEHDAHADSLGPISVDYDADGEKLTRLPSATCLRSRGARRR